MTVNRREILNDYEWEPTRFNHPLSLYEIITRLNIKKSLVSMIMSVRVVLVVACPLWNNHPLTPIARARLFRERTKDCISVALDYNYFQKYSIWGPDNTKRVLSQ